MTVIVPSVTKTPDNYNTVTITSNGGGGGGGGGVGTSCNHYGAVPPLGSGAVGATGTFTLPSGSINIVNSGSGYGSPGSVYSTTGWQSPSNVTMNTSILSIMAEGNGDAMIKTKKHEINLDEMAEVVETLKQRLLILTPNFEMHEKYPVLKDLYDQYKVVEAMLKEENKK